LLLLTTVVVVYRRYGSGDRMSGEHRGIDSQGRERGSRGMADPGGCR